ncbi:MAG: hypothetical protein EOP49_07910 [Sphingobacteriales bacterium]|nr:MAG: hypothetical protein EOP49_07910 [Sphingobacteriales bacterium]
MQLRDEHILAIEQRLHKEGIRDQQLHAELLDHICSYIEESDSNAFELLMQDAFQMLAPAGMHEIEEEQYFLLHLNKQLTMKKIMFFSGFATTFLLTSGITFKQLHWPGASIMLVSGFAGLIITILLIAANAYRHRDNHTAAHNVRIYTGIAAALLIAVGSIFKFFHLPSANIQFVLGMLLLNFIFLPLFFFQLYRQSVARI